LWKVRHGGYTPASRPLFDRGVAYITTGNGKPEMLALLVDGRGDVTDTKVVLAFSHGPPVQPSAVINDGLVFMVQRQRRSPRAWTRPRAPNFWHERLGGEFSASTAFTPTAAFIALGRNGRRNSS